MTSPQKMDSQDLCDAFSHRDQRGVFSLSKSASDSLFAEINSRKLLTQDFIGSVVTHEIKLGMSEHDVLCSRGTPERVNSTETKRGRSEQWVYGRSYVYFRNSKVDAIQE